MGTCRITFEPGERQVVVAAGTDLLTAAVNAGVQLYNGCGGEGVCTECKVIVREGEVAGRPAERLTEEERRAGYVLACQTRVLGDVQVEVPREATVEREQILTEDLLAEVFARPEEATPGQVAARRSRFPLSPLSTKRFLRLPRPTATDNISDLERVHRELQRGREAPPALQTELGNVRKLARLLRQSDWRVTATLVERPGVTAVVLVEPGDASRRNYGVAVDIGTTTVAASLVDLHGGRTLGTKATHNRQILHGRDVITRLINAEQEEGLGQLNRAVVDTINELIAALLEEARVDADEVTALSCAGNTTMTHLLLRIDPYYLRRDPYVPTANWVPAVQPVEVGIKTNPGGVLFCLPGVSSYVGGDITAGVLACGMDEAEQPAMLIDLGTNGEIVLGDRDWLVCCSASAGTAFEGRGVRAGARAVQSVEIDPHSHEVRWATVGGEAPIGLCGSGFIDLLAELFSAGIIDRQGAIRTDVPDPRVRQGEDGAEFVVVPAAQSGTGRDLTVSDAGLANLIRAKAAIFSAARVLVKKMGMTFADVERIYIGGGFGNYLDIEKAVRIGLLPDLPRDRFMFIGNSSLAGAKLALLSDQARAKAQEIAARMTNLELCAEPSYMGEYVGALFLPHTDSALFPSVRLRMESPSPCPAS